MRRTRGRRAARRPWRGPGQCCGGLVELRIERYTRADLALLRSAQRAACRGAVVLDSVATAVGVERRIVRAARADGPCARLLSAPRAQALPRLCLGPGGQASLLERLDDALPPLWLYGAGHVGRAVARIAAELPLHLTWVDSRAGHVPGRPAGVGRDPARPGPGRERRRRAAGARFLVMTHSHPLDYALCRAILSATISSGWG